MFRNAAGSRRKDSASAVTRLLLTAIAFAIMVSVCPADSPLGPILAPGQTLYGHFTQARSLKDVSEPLKSDGNFVLVPAKGLIWRVEHPIQTTTVITAAGIRQIINGTEVKRIDAARTPAIAHFYYMLDSALVGDWSAMQAEFAVSSTGNRGAWRTVLIPARSDGPTARILASVVITGGRLVDSVDITRASGDSDQVWFFGQTVSIITPNKEDSLLLDSNGPDSADD
jgi:hypothetical protein